MVSLFAIAPGWAQTASAVSEPVVTIAPGQTLELRVKPREYQTVRVAAASDHPLEFRMALPGAGARGSYVKVQPEPASGPAAADPVISDSGLDFVRLVLPPGGSTASSLHITILTNSKTDTAPLATTISVTPVSGLSASADCIAAQAAFNHAERLRRSHVGGDTALAAYKDAWQEAQTCGDRVFEQQVLLSTGRMLMLDGKHYAESVEWERKAVALDGTDAAPSVQAMAWKMLGGALLDTDQYQESMDASSRALALYEKTGETFWQGVVLENLGEAELDLGDLPKALATEERALAISRQLHDDFGVVETLAEIGSIHRTRGEYQAALNDFSEAVEVSLPTSYNPMQGEAWLAMGELHGELAETQRAADDLGRALTIAQHTSSGLDELEAMKDLAALHLHQGDLAAAQAGFRAALERARELKLVRPQSGLLIGLAQTSLTTGHPDQAEPLLHQAIELAESIHQESETAEALLALGKAASAQGRNKDAAADFAKAAELYQGIPDKAGLAEADLSLARVEDQTGDDLAALDHLRQAMDIVESSRTSFSRGALRTRFFAAQRATYEQAIAMLMKQDAAEPGRGFAAEAWRVAERARARSLLDELWAGDPTHNTGPESAALGQRLAALEVRIGTLEEQQAQAGTSAEDLQKVSQTQSQLRSAVLEADELESRIRTAEPLNSAPAGKLTPESLAQTALQRDDALVEYWTAPSGSYAWLITSDGHCEGFRLPSSDALLERTTRYRQALLARIISVPGEMPHAREARITAADAKAGQLGKALAGILLPAPLQQRLAGVQRLLLVTDGPLAQIPFAGLRLSGDRAGQADRYLVERFEVLQEPSAGYLALVRSDAGKPVAGQPLRVAVFADPVYNAADSRLAGARTPALSVAMQTGAGRAPAEMGGLAQLARLPGSRLEAQRIAGIAGPERSSVHLGFEATSEAVKDLEWSRFPVAHFAVHALYATGGRDAAGMLLSVFDSQGRRENGILWARDILNLHIARKLVVLSGCGTALGEAVPGEGMNSLAHAFLFSGTRQVAATLWSADDASSSALMEGFYRELLGRGADVAEALRASQLGLMRQPRYAAPVFWAGFVVEGSASEGRWQTP